MALGNVRAHALRARGAFEIVSLLTVTPDVLWAQATSLDGVKYELAPWLAMTMPKDLDEASFVARLGGGEVALPSKLGRSWILLFGWIPMDYDDIGVAEVEPGRRFLEQSTMASMVSWQHERIIESIGEGLTRITDRLAWVPRAFVPERLAARIVRAVFEHRHARLRERFGATP